MYYEVNRYTVEAARWTRPGRLRIALLADLHNNIWPGLLEKLAAEQPDIILIAGDMVNSPTKHHDEAFGRAYGLVKRLAAAYPVYYVFGNHEARWHRTAGGPGSQYAGYVGGLKKKGVHFLINGSVLLGEEGQRLRITGLDLGKEFYSHKHKLTAPTAEAIRELVGEPLKNAPGGEDVFELLTAHTPCFPEAYRDFGADLTLSGHLHGGQVRLPWIGGLIAPGFRLFPPYTKGLYERDGCRMIVSAGLGTHTIPFRVFDPRELVIVDLVKE